MKGMITILMLVFFLSFCVAAQTKITVRKKISAIQITEGYHILESDSIITLNNNKYLIMRMECFEANNLTSIAIWKPLGYLEFSKDELSGSSKFLNSNGLNIKASIIGDRIKVNDKLYRMVSQQEDSKSIYFFNNKDKRELYIIRFQ